jgi:hypothetical protein
MLVAIKSCNSPMPMHVIAFQIHLMHSILAASLAAILAASHVTSLAR